MQAKRYDPSIYQMHKLREICPNWQSSHFQRAIQSSSHYMEKLELLHVLHGHDGCVNSVLFSDSGNHIITGSDDMCVKLFDACSGEQVDSMSTIHTNNIFFAKDLPSTSFNVPETNSVEWILTCAADGRVALSNMETKGSRLLYRHRGRAHRVSLVPRDPQKFFSCGEDGICCLFDLRDKTHGLFSAPPDEELYSLVHNNSLPSLKIHFRPRGHGHSSAYAIAVNPKRPHEVAIGGTHSKVCVYDIRNPEMPIHFHSPTHLRDSRQVHVTGMKYSYNGDLILATYNDDDVYTFISDVGASPDVGGSTRVPTQRINSSPWLSMRQSCLGRMWSTMLGYRRVNDDIIEGDEEGIEEEIRSRGYFQRYSGHRNHATVKQVNFLGGHSEFVISGSDCGHIFIWDTYSSKLVNVLHGDEIGAVNCLSQHPHLPIIATSGLESEAKVWAPIGDHSPLSEGSDIKRNVDRIIQRNPIHEDEEDRSQSFNSAALRNILRLILARRRQGGDDGGDDIEPGNTRTFHQSVGQDEDEDEDQPRRNRVRLDDMDIEDLFRMVVLQQAGIEVDNDSSDDESWGASSSSADDGEAEQEAEDSNGDLNEDSEHETSVVDIESEANSEGDESVWEDIDDEDTSDAEQHPM